MNLLMSLKGYGTTVVWGNCCGAVKGEEKAIGGCGVAGMSEIKVFGNECKCDNSCDQIEACVFKVKLPLSYALSKTKALEYEDVVTHEIKRKS